MRGVRNAGSVFLGGSAVIGDYAAGATHVLPTGGLARSRAGSGSRRSSSPCRSCARRRRVRARRGGRRPARACRRAPAARGSGRARSSRVSGPVPVPVPRGSSPTAGRRRAPRSQSAPASPPTSCCASTRTSHRCRASRRCHSRGRWPSSTCTPTARTASCEKRPPRTSGQGVGARRRRSGGRRPDPPHRARVPAGGRRASIVEPTYSLYRIASELAGASWGADPAGASVIWRCNPTTRRVRCCRAGWAPGPGTGPPARARRLDEAYVEYGGASAVGARHSTAERRRPANDVQGVRARSRSASGSRSPRRRSRRRSSSAARPTPISDSCGAHRGCRAARPPPRGRADDRGARARARCSRGRGASTAPPVAGNFVWGPQHRTTLGALLEEKGHPRATVSNDGVAHHPPSARRERRPAAGARRRAGARRLVARRSC